MIIFRFPTAVGWAKYKVTRLVAYDRHRQPPFIEIDLIDWTNLLESPPLTLELISYYDVNKGSCRPDVSPCMSLLRTIIKCR